MNFLQAQKEMAKGRSVKRPNWETSISMKENTMAWDITESLARVCNENKSADRTYSPSEIDRKANDWTAL